MTLVQCRWCGGDWNTDISSVGDHEARCPHQIECPRCGAQPLTDCFYPGGQTVAGGAHGAREKAMRARLSARAEASDA